jgi:hypothetical protein
MTTPRGELVFVPLVGAVRPEDWTKVMHRKVWGLLDDDMLYVLHAERMDGPNPPFSDLLSHDAPLRLFEAELELVERNPTTVPAIVSQRLAVLALAPDQLGAANQ